MPPPPITDGSKKKPMPNRVKPKNKTLPKNFDRGINIGTNVLRYNENTNVQREYEIPWSYLKYKGTKKIRNTLELFWIAT